MIHSCKPDQASRGTPIAVPVTGNGTPATIPISFKLGRTGEYESVKLGVRAVEVGPDGKIVRGLREGEEGPYRYDWRGIFFADARRQLFILLKNKSYGSQ